MPTNENPRVPELVRRVLENSAAVKMDVARRYSGEIADAAQLVAGALMNEQKIMFCGNGGSAADSQHLAAELTGRFQTERIPLPGLALTTDSSVLTAIGNDYGFDNVFARQVSALSRPGDVLMALSTSGRSPNVVKAVEVAHRMNCRVIGLTGGSGGELAQQADISVVIPSDNSARVQEVHITIGHIICEVLDVIFAQIGVAI